MDTSITCLNGHFLPAHEALLPLSGRGARFGDGVFETIAIVRGVPCWWEQHLRRLQAGLQALRIKEPTVDWQAMAKEMLRRNSSSQGFLRISISRASDSQGYLPLTPPNCIWAIEYLPARAASAHPCRLLLSHYRRPSPQTAPVNCKLSQGIGNSLALLDAQEGGCDEALMLSSDGELASATSANLFWIHKGRCYTPPLSTGCLDGITRRQVMEHSGEAVQEQRANLTILQQADAVFLTNSRVGIWPVERLQPCGTRFDHKHPIIRQISSVFQRQKNDYISENTEYWKNNS